MRGREEGGQAVVAGEAREIPAAQRTVGVEGGRVEGVRVPVEELVRIANHERDLRAWAIVAMR